METGTAIDVLELLALPGLAKLTEQQVRGTTCVWDGVPLTSATAVDLGERAASRAGQPVRWFPRGCHPCTSKAALQALHKHAPTCEQCVDEAALCEVGRGLNRLMREARR
ncbi:hypothetical protein [Streptomyces sp. NPDC058086]|uniref:hypothetical protein n=1 Tax=Streptomyces sp. NPDC058086 TaxID=3346334 RepID=UPI0036EAFC51